jgi:DNA polymerase/3'-5' exonuclease PolX
MTSYGPGTITKSTAGKLFMNAKTLYDCNGKTPNMPKGTKSTSPPIGWLMSEKFDGYRAIWDGKRFVSRQGNTYNAPEWFTKYLPIDIVLDGELYAGRDNFQKCGAVRHKIPNDDGWLNIVYQVYDIPSLHNQPFHSRYNILTTILKELNEQWKKSDKGILRLNNHKCPYRMTMHYKIKDEEHMNEYYMSIIKNSGEGIMLKSPESLYEGRRSPYLLKYKPQFDAEAMIIGYNYGSGKYSGILGSFICAPIKDTTVINERSLYFAISGMNDIIRKNYKETHPIGTIVTYNYSGMTEDGKPRFAGYSKIREDIELTEDINNDNIKTDEKPTPISYNDKNKLIMIFDKLYKHELENREQFKARVYKKTIDTLIDLKGDVIEKSHLEAINAVKGIGKKIIEKIEEYLSTGSITLYNKISVNDIDRNIKDELSNIYGIGHVKAKELVEKMGVKSIGDLKLKTELLNSKQKIGLKYYEDLLQRIPRKETELHDKYIVNTFNSIGCNAYLMGSYRRKTKDNGDIDVLVSCNDDNSLKFKEGIDLLIKMGYLVENLAYGQKKYMGICKLNIKGKKFIYRRIDIMFTPLEEVPFALLYFTGSANLNKVMRKKALDMGYSINEHTIIDKKTKDPIIDYVFKTERDIFKFLKMDYLEPENR